jgi:alpha-D-xyloside xylohydrolase
LDEWRELNTRWYQFGVFCPLFRVHGQYPLREIFNIAPEDHPAYKSMLYYNKLRYSLMPYIYTLAGNTFHSDYTIMRALVMDFPADLKVLNIGDQFMFGPSFMVCPVYEYKSRSREVYLPEGDGWYDFYTGNFTEGGQSLTASAPIERVPLYVKAGSIIPVGPDKEYTMQPDDGELTLWIYTGKDAEFRLYEDEGTNNNYEKGACSWILFKYVEKERKLDIGARLGSYKGIRETRKINVVVIDPASPKGFNTSAASIKSISYHGEKQIIEL